MEMVALPDLAPILAAVLGPVLVFVGASMRYQHIDSTKNRDLIVATSTKNRDLIEAATKENRELIEKFHADLSGSIGDVRERLAHIEGFLKAGPPDRHDPEEDSAEAA